MPTQLEICIDDVDGAITADRAGADRVELCDNLLVGGTTPSLGTIERTLARVERIGVQVIIRPRGGDFVYSPIEVEVMLRDIAAIRALPSAATPLGFVIGALTPDGRVDAPVCRELVAACGDHPVTFHKAFDFARDLDEALEDVIALGASRILTSGGWSSVIDGLADLAHLHQRAAGRISIMPGGGVRVHNVTRIIAATGVGEVHMKAQEPRASQMTYRNPRLSLSADDDVRLVTSAARITEVLEALGRGPAQR